jgi:hypothetical protein
MKALRRPGENSWTRSLAEITPLTGRTLYEHVTSLLRQDGRGPIPNAGEPLPDEPPLDPSKLRWSGGSLDGIMALRGGRSEGNGALAAAAGVLAALGKAPSTRDVHRVAELLREVDGPQAMDRFLGAVREAKTINKACLRELARWLCLSGVTRQQVKAGIALLGLAGDPATDADLITRLGLLEELTLYSAVALSNMLEDSDLAILNLADQVENWGRIHCVHRLRRSNNPEVRRWLLYGGYKNGVMTEEIAYIAASTGGLREALEDDADDGLLDHAGGLLAALALGGPAEDMSDYADGADALDMYFRRMTQAPATLARLRHLDTLEGYLDKWADDNPHLDRRRRVQLRGELSAVLARGDWRQVAADALSSTDLGEVKRAITLVRRFDIDPVPVVQGWLTQAPVDPYLWQTLLHRADRDEIRRLVQVAEKMLPFASIPTGPARDLGVGPGQEASHCFDMILQRLRDFPGEGESAIALGLICRVTRARNMAIRAVEAWPMETRPPALVDALRQMAWSDPDSSLKKRGRRVADGLPSEEQPPGLVG